MLLLFLLIVVDGLVAFSGMAGCLVSVAVMRGVLGLLLFGFGLSWNVAWVVIRWVALVIGLRLILAMLTILLWRCRIILIFGRMVAGRIIGDFDVAGAGVYLP